MTGFDYAPYRDVRGGGSDDDLVRVSRELLLDAVRRNPTPEARHALGRALVASGDYAGAIAQLELASAESPSDAGVLTDLAVARAASGDAAGALADLDRALVLDPSSPEALFDRAALVASTGPRDAAREAIERFLARDGDSPWAGEARRMLADLDRAAP
jgi:Flp pilus assembly protein TadD